MKDLNFTRGCIALLVSVAITVIPHFFDDNDVSAKLDASLMVLREATIAVALWQFAKSKSLTENDNNNEE